ncbi:hypothetical protein GLAREA_07575 [Glarea lozoyensis ATCC 20868]|uniref:Uncharacterized protein n=1 Tax=Glarea lozoyensis (strain ATCC 20868 / MF5171) TaxID=1116229 RepID=S3D1M0_GLAL2|nr:uncharacterized protein GLAREA_07575 [Glarea lozoyensis ATCC 20868]EPE32442.1 hypothetical protein GLAREA_07575 [Glarea lozoyensis ATCC 20868]
MYTFAFLRGVLELFFVGFLISVSRANIIQKRLPAQLQAPTFYTYCCPVGGQSLDPGSKAADVNSNIDKIRSGNLTLEVEAKSCKDLVCTGDSSVQICTENNQKTPGNKDLVSAMVQAISVQCFGAPTDNCGQIFHETGINVILSKKKCGS